MVGVTSPPRARLIRVIHAELERIANHLDVVMRLCDAAGLAVPLARFGWHKECILRLISALCGNRFGRSLVCAGGVTAEPQLAPTAISEQVAAILHRVRGDRDALMIDASFLDRLRGTGYLDASLAASHGALGPVGRGSGCDDDARLRAYDGYAELPVVAGAAVDHDGDALARLRVRWAEIDMAANLIQRSCDGLATMADKALTVETPTVDGFALGWAEAPQGEVLYALEVRGGVIGRCFARSAPSIACWCFTTYSEGTSSPTFRSSKPVSACATPGWRCRCHGYSEGCAMGFSQPAGPRAQTSTTTTSQQRCR